MDIRPRDMDLSLLLTSAPDNGKHTKISEPMIRSEIRELAASSI